MAEFSEVMAQLNRLCRTFTHCDDDGCPLLEMGCCGNIGSHCSEQLQVERIEKTIMAWAAEHPEPVYPTWREWLIKNGLIDFKADFHSALYNQLVNVVYECLNEKASEPIPADIAIKLGLEPKEGT